MRKWYCITFIISVLIPYSIGGCLHTWRKKVGYITCTNITQDEYLNELFQIKINITDTIEDRNITKLSINIADSNITNIDDWIYVPWDDLFVSVYTLKIVNSSVTTIKSLEKFYLLDTLDLSANNISDYSFLSKLKKLRHLYVRNSSFDDDSFLFTYLQRYQNRLKLVDLRYGTLKQFNSFNSQTDKYDLSENPYLELINFNHTFQIQYLNLSGNSQLQLLTNNIKGDFICISSLNLSNLNTSFNFSLLNNIKISDEIVLSNNNIKTLDEHIFPLEKLLSNKCSKSFGISLDFSNAKLENISNSYFSNQILNLVNLSHNNFVNLKGSIFSRSAINVLDLSNSNISVIHSEVLNYAIVTLLNLSNNNITSLGEVFDKIDSIKELDLSSNPVQTLTPNVFKNSKSLKVLNLTNTFVTSFEENTLSCLPSLKSLTLSFTDRINISAIKNMYVTELTIINSSLKSLEPENFKGFYKLTKLTFLNSSVSSVSTLAFKGLSILKVLNIEKLTRPNRNINIFKYLFGLEELDLSNHNLKDMVIEFNTLNSFKKLNLSSNMMLELDVNMFVSLKKLEVLSLANNQLSNIVLGTFQPLQKLTHLYLNKNSFQKLSPGVFSDLNNLILLDLSQNQLYRSQPHIWLSTTLPVLKYLHLQNNKLGNEYVANENILRKNEFSVIALHDSLEYIDINHNEWSCSTLIDVLIIFKNKNITYNPTNPVYRQTNINGVICS